MRKSSVPVKTAVVLFCLLLTASVAGAATVLRMNHQFPETAAGSANDQWFADAVKTATNGELDIRIYWNNGLGAAKENLPMLKAGHIDMAAMSPGYFAAEMPFFSAPNSIPMALDTICQSSVLMKTLMEQVPAFEKEASDNGVRPLFFHLLNPYLLVSKTPVKTFEDLKGLRIRTWGEEIPLLVGAAGATPIPLFLPDIKETLERGVINACPFSKDLVVTYKLYEMAPHITEVVMWEGPAWGIWISTKTWEKLSEPHREALLSAAETARHREIEQTLKSEREAAEFLSANGVTFHPFPPEELAKWRAASPDFFALWVEKMDKLGKGEAARETVKLWNEIRGRVQECP